jgi:hypothetical protein
MTAQLTQIIVQQHIADLRRQAHQTRPREKAGDRNATPRWRPAVGRLRARLLAARA